MRSPKSQVKQYDGLRECGSQPEREMYDFSINIYIDRLYLTYIVMFSIYIFLIYKHFILFIYLFLHTRIEYYFSIVRV